MPVYTKDDLQLQHYHWDLPEVLDTNVLDSTPLDVLNGHEMLAFSTLFLECYIPGHTKEDLNAVEFVIVDHLPKYIKAKNDIAFWIARHMNFFKWLKRSSYLKDTAG